MLGESMPKSVQAAGGNYFYKSQITTPDSLTAHFEFESCPVVWRHRLWGAREYNPDVNNGIFLFGEKETLFVTDNRWEIIAGDRKEDRKVMEIKGGDLGKSHIADFLDAVRARKAPLCVPEDGYRSTATVQLGMIAYESATQVVWDATQEQIIDNPKAAKLLKRDYRPPWKHPCAG